MIVTTIWLYTYVYYFENFYLKKLFESLVFVEKFHYYVENARIYDFLSERNRVLNQVCKSSFKFLYLVGNLTTLIILYLLKIIIKNHWYIYSWKWSVATWSVNRNSCKFMKFYYPIPTRIWRLLMLELFEKNCFSNIQVKF